MNRFKTFFYCKDMVRFCLGGGTKTSEIRALAYLKRGHTIFKYKKTGVVQNKSDLLLKIFLFTFLHYSYNLKLNEIKPALN